MPTIARVGRLAFGPSIAPPDARDVELRRFTTDLTAPYGLLPDHRYRPASDPDTYAEMGERLLGTIGPLAEPLDVVVLAHAVPDTDPRRATAHHIRRLCPGDPLAFAITDQGSATPFQALSVIREYLRGGARTALLLVMERAGLPYPTASALPDPATGVAVLFGATGPARVTSVCQHPGVAPQRVGALVAAELAGRDADVVLVVNDALRPNLRQEPSGRAGCGVWWQLAAGLDTWLGDGRPVLLADYDPDLRYLSFVDIRSARSAETMEDRSKKSTGD